MTNAEAENTPTLAFEFGPLRRGRLKELPKRLQKPFGSQLVPQAGLEPALLSEPHFECGASTNFTTGAVFFRQSANNSRAEGVTATRRLLYNPRMFQNSRFFLGGYLALSVAVIAFVLFSQHVQGYQPCELCLRERLPWFIVIGLAVIGVIAPSRWVLLLIGVVLLCSAGFGLHHVGVEQGWWPGPDACTSNTNGAKTIEELREMLHNAPMVRCDEITWTLIGLSMTSYNFLLSLAASIVAFLTAYRKGHHAT